MKKFSVSLTFFTVHDDTCRSEESRPIVINNLSDHVDTAQRVTRLTLYWPGGLPLTSKIVWRGQGKMLKATLANKGKPKQSVLA